MTLLQSSSSGSILFDDCDILHHRKEIRSVLGYLPQDFRFFEKLKTWEFLDYGAGLAGIRGKRKRAEVVDELLRKVGLYEVRDRWANRLSGGMKRRLGIAQAIVGNPKIIIVDEPTTGLENRTFNCNDSGLVCMVLGDSLRTGKRRRNSAEVRGYAMKGKVYPGEAEWLESWAKVPSDEWLELMKQWNPEKFDAKEWVRRFKAAGFRYIKITTKQHEGFCLWPSEYSPYNVARTPYGKDILVELVQACGEEGMDIHFYFSVMDWSHPDWRYDIGSREDSIAFRRFLAFMDNQLKELATRYPSVKDFWFDGTWDSSIKKNAWWTVYAEQMLKELVPGVTVNSRLRSDEYGKRHFDSNGHLMGGYESGYERRLPDAVKDLQVPRRDWEVCMTIPENQWGYHKDWSLIYVKKTVESIGYIVHAVSMGKIWL